MSFWLVPVARSLFRINEFTLKKPWEGVRKVRWGGESHLKDSSESSSGLLRPLCLRGYDNRDLALCAGPEVAAVKVGSEEGVEKVHRCQRWSTVGSVGEWINTPQLCAGRWS